jgi:serine/threonine protein phosphatase 1
MIKHFPINKVGNDYVVGDLHGCFTILQTGLNEINFDVNKDRLFSVGDLVDRGPESEESLDWLAKPWFHPVRGNHEQLAIDCANDIYDPHNYNANGGAWFMELSPDRKKVYAKAFSWLPIAIEVDTAEGMVGIIHAEFPFKSWSDLDIALKGPNSESFIMQCIWGRDRINRWGKSIVEGIKEIIVGHTVVKESIYLGNVRYIDTGAVFGKYLTIIRIN